MPPRKKLPQPEYRTTRDIIIPAGTPVTLVTRMKQDILRAAMSVVSVGNDMHFDWIMYFEDALELGYIEKTDERSAKD